MRAFLLAFALACSCKNDTDDTPTDGYAGTDTDSNIDDADTDLVGREGSYVGNLHVDVVDSGIIVHNASCDDPAFTLVIDAAGAITGSGQCTTTEPLDGRVFEATLTGDVDIDPNAHGDVTVEWSLVPMPIDDDWQGPFSGDDTLEGAFDGGWSEGSHAFAFTATFTVTR